jgi:hypothetical protein
LFEADSIGERSALEFLGGGVVSASQRLAAPSVKSTDTILGTS